MTHLIHLGRGGVIDADQIVAIAQANSAPVKRLLEYMGPERVLDMTYGEPRGSLVLLRGGFAAIVVPTPEDLYQRIGGNHDP